MRRIHLASELDTGLKYLSSAGAGIGAQLVETVVGEEQEVQFKLDPSLAGTFFHKMDKVGDMSLFEKLRA